MALIRWRALLAAIVLVAAGPAAAQLCGDLDDDGYVDHEDALILRSHEAGSVLLLPWQSLRCDVISELRPPELFPDPEDLSGACSMVDAAVLERTGQTLPPPPQGACAAASTAACCGAHAGVGCEEEDRALCACALDPTCCTLDWDSACAAIACGPECAYTCENGEACDDGNACTIGDVCDAVGLCAGTLSCDDANVCTSDSCVAEVCEHASTNPGQASCGVGACFVTGPICLGGALNPCQPLPPSPEVCNGVDDDCDATTDEGLVDAFESNETCATNRVLSNLQEGASFTLASASIHPTGDTDWFRQRTLETNGFCVPGASEGPYVYGVTMTPPAGVNYDLEVCWKYHSDSSCTLRGCFSSATHGAGVAETVQWISSGVCGSEDGRDYYIRVYPVALSHTCAPYSLVTSYHQ